MNRPTIVRVTKSLSPSWEKLEEKPYSYEFGHCPEDWFRAQAHDRGWVVAEVEDYADRNTRVIIEKIMPLEEAQEFRSRVLGLNGDVDRTEFPGGAYAVWLISEKGELTAKLSQLDERIREIEQRTKNAGRMLIR